MIGTLPRGSVFISEVSKAGVMHVGYIKQHIVTDKHKTLYVYNGMYIQGTMMITKKSCQLTI